MKRYFAIVYCNVLSFYVSQLVIDFMSKYRESSAILSLIFTGKLCHNLKIIIIKLIAVTKCDHY